jgi:hypothetical protein
MRDRSYQIICSYDRDRNPDRQLPKLEIDRAPIPNSRTDPKQKLSDRQQDKLIQQHQQKPQMTECNRNQRQTQCQAHQKNNNLYHYISPARLIVYPEPIATDPNENGNNLYY